MHQIDRINGLEFFIMPAFYRKLKPFLCLRVNSDAYVRMPYALPFDITQREAVQRKLDEYNSCRCCSKHADKPTSWAPWVELPPHYTQCGPGDCHCPCRHNARIFGRMHPGATQAYEQAMRRHAERLLTEPFVPKNEPVGPK